jgi:hypothetical protein
MELPTARQPVEEENNNNNNNNGDRHYIYAIYCIITNVSVELDITLLKTDYQLT